MGRDRSRDWQPVRDLRLPLPQHRGLHRRDEHRACGNGDARCRALWGQLDLAGEVSEWTLDGYTHNYVNPCADCANTKATSFRAVRSGGFAVPTSYLLPPVRIGFIPGGRDIDIGFRCARSP